MMRIGRRFDPRRAARALALAAAVALTLALGSTLCLAVPVAAQAARTGSASMPEPAEPDAPTRAVLVTGATSGIGLRMAEVLSRNGFYVYAGARKPDDMARLDAMPNVTAVRLDVTIQEDIDAAVARVEGEGRGLYGLINNAGIATMEPLIEMPEEVMRYQLDVNLVGPYRVTKAFADLLIQSGGRVMNTSSIAGIVTGPLSGAYSMSKHGLEAYTDGLAAELDRFGVAVAAVEPGNYRSEIVASMARRMRERGYTGQGSRYGDMLAMLGGDVSRSEYREPDDVAAAALDFMTADSPKRRYMVVPNRGEAELTIRGALAELAQLNHDQPFAFTRDELVAMLDRALLDAPPAPGSAASRTPAGDEPGGDARAAGDVPGAAAGRSLVDAAFAGDLEAVRRHIEAGSDLDVREPTGGSTPLMVATIFDHADVALALIDAGADLDARNNDGSTALHSAALFCRTEVVRALLDAGADRSIRNNTGATPLDIVTAPFEALRGTYDYLATVLGPFGLKLDYDRLRDTRPGIAEMLR